MFRPVKAIIRQILLYVAELREYWAQTRIRNVDVNIKYRLKLQYDKIKIELQLKLWFIYFILFKLQGESIAKNI
jgi:hypothetical protein